MDTASTTANITDKGRAMGTATAALRTATTGRTGDAVGNRILSASQLSCYLMCPRKYAFRYVERLEAEHRSSALCFGSAVHSALEWFHDERLLGHAPDPLDVVSVFLADWDSEQERPIRFKEDETPDTLAALGMALIRLYLERFATQEVAAVEVPFEIDLVDPETGEVLIERLRGYYDLLWPGDVIVEMKTSARRFDAADLRRRLQLSAYADAYRQVHGRDPSIVVINLLKTKRPAIDVQHTERVVEDDAWFVHMAMNIVRGIDAGAFPPNPSWSCTDCEYAQACSMWRDHRLVSLQERRRLPMIPGASIASRRALHTS